MYARVRVRRLAADQRVDLVDIDIPRPAKGTVFKAAWAQSPSSYFNYTYVRLTDWRLVIRNWVPMKIQ